jgi:hypothetical protein
MPMCCHRSGDIDEMHHVPAQQFAQRVGLRRQHDLGHFRP